MLIISNIKNILYKLKLILKSPIYICSTIGLFLLLFTSVAYTDFSENGVMTAQVLFDYIMGDNKWLDSFSDILLFSGNSYYYHFAPVIVVLPFLIFYREEKSTNYCIYQLSRQKLGTYKIESYITCILSVGVMSLISSALYDALFICISKGVELDIQLLLVHNSLMTLSVIVSSIIQLAIMSLTNNVFSTLGLFFTINYYVNVASQKAFMSEGSVLISYMPDEIIANLNGIMDKAIVVYIILFKIIAVLILEAIICSFRRNNKC